MVYLICEVAENFKFFCLPLTLLEIILSLYIQPRFDYKF
jgi:hypothetical protein